MFRKCGGPVSTGSEDCVGTSREPLNDSTGIDGIHRSVLSEPTAASIAAFRALPDLRLEKLEEWVSPDGVVIATRS
jgi:hypothetical protein